MDKMAKWNVISYIFIVIGAAAIICVLLFSFYAGIRGPVKGNKGPYLLYTGSAESMTILWQTERTPAFSKISWGTSESYGNEALTKENSAAPWAHQFSYTITGLLPDTKIYYRVSTDLWSYSSFFWTPRDDHSASLVFYAYGDTRGNEKENNKILSLILKDMNMNNVHGTFLLHSGDFATYGLDERSLEKDFFSRHQPETRSLQARIPVMYAVGNHDCYSTPKGSSPKNTAGGLLRKYWPFRFAPKAERSYYSFQYGPVFVCVLDEYTKPGYCTPPDDPEQYAWAKTKISSSKKPWKVVLTHDPIFGPRIRSYPGDFQGNHLNMQKYYHPLFVDSSVDVVVQGHNPLYARCSKDKVTYLTAAGGGGSPLEVPQLKAPNLITARSAFNFVKFVITGNTMSVEAVDDSGKPIDSFNIVQPP